MISGSVSANGIPSISTRIADRTYRGVIDTGFNSDLELPKELATVFKAEFIGTAKFNLASGVSVQEEVFRTEFPFDGTIVRADATFVDSDHILIGTHLLRNDRLSINFVACTVRLKRLN